MKLAVFADGIVGYEITSFLLKNYRNDVTVIVTIDNEKINKLSEMYGCQKLYFKTEEETIKSLPKDLDMGLLAWWPKILREPLLNFPKMGFINTHPSLLPFNRGKHYNFWALVEQAPFGVTLHQVDKGVDTGDIIAQKRIEYDWTDNGESLYRKAQYAMISLFEETWPKLRQGDLKPFSQPPNIGSFHKASELLKASKIDLDRQYSARDLLNLLRAKTFTPHPGCWFEESGEYYEVSVCIKKVGSYWEDEK